MNHSVLNASYPSTATERHPHPAAPKEIDFKHFQEVYRSGPHFNPDKVKSPAQLAAAQSSGQGASSQASSTNHQHGAVEDLHQLPERFWKTPALLLDEAEMDAINSGGASLRS
ncbi:hypothetical protein K437DRAFT_23576 [Tilletiaria anomala UBC 951]|uniref:Uncharacterized protein n=1 Tax=Tilletiaria anomala (strain ATCC 24038 / CBS 436.72 / UBC 951) TaxID=1037660 RepID=A0A066V9I3_TILAU|nr:uncharacterized protein K437DRAFT_23576 [Tilletiaria anomala UBC 951]KDN38377.1 hypothetical protein K437DRAFT_23576 [Tilletiaria anomala UBC 951]